MKKNKTSIMIFSIFAVIGILLIAGAIILFVNGMRFRQSAVSITGEIEDILYSYDSDGEIDHEVFVTYTFEGKTYDMVRISEYSSNMYIGKSITLLCDPENPGNVKIESSIFFVFITLMIMGIISFCIGAVPCIISLKKSHRAKYLLAHGRVLCGTVEHVDLNRSYRVNGRHPFVIYCAWKDEYSDTLYRFKSDNLWTDPSHAFPEGSEIDIYVDRNDFGKYYVDVEHKLSQRVVDFTM